MRTSYAETTSRSWVPCLAVKGTNLISRGGGGEGGEKGRGGGAADGRGYKKGSSASSSFVF